MSFELEAAIGTYQEVLSLSRKLRVFHVRLKEQLERLPERDLPQYHAEAERLEAGGEARKLTEEPPCYSFVLAKYGDHPIAGDLFHRDDREGHGDPVEAPQRWWSHGWKRWISWPEIKGDAERDGRVLLLLHTLEGR